MTLISYHETRYHPEYVELGAIVGRAKVGHPDRWPEWARLIEKYGWRRVIRAADMCDPHHRWSADVEKWCREIDKQEASAAKQAAQDAANAEMKEKAKAKGRLVNVDGKWIVQEVSL